MFLVATAVSVAVLLEVKVLPGCVFAAISPERSPAPASGTDNLSHTLTPEGRKHHNSLSYHNKSTSE